MIEGYSGTILLYVGYKACYCILRLPHIVTAFVSLRLFPSGSTITLSWAQLLTGSMLMGPIQSRIVPSV